MGLRAFTEADGPPTQTDVLADSSPRAAELALGFERHGDLSPDEWDALADCCAEPNPFFESWYLGAALRRFDGMGAQLLVARREGLMVGLMPLHRPRAYYGYPLPHLGTWLHSQAFCGVPLVLRGEERAFWRALFRFADDNAQGAAFLHLPSLPEDGPVARALAAEGAAQGRALAVVGRHERALLRAGKGAEELFADSVNAKRRKEFRRREKRLFELGDITFERTRDGAGITQWVADFLALELDGWKGGGGTALASDPATAAFFREAVMAASRRNRLDRLTLRHEGRMIGALATFTGTVGWFAYKTAYDEGYARYSPGVWLQRRFLDVLDADAPQWVDSCAAPDHPMIDHFWRDRRRVISVNMPIGGVFRRAAGKILITREAGRHTQGMFA